MRLRFSVYYYNVTAKLPFMIDMSHDIQCVSKNDTAVVCYNFDEHRTILIIFGRNIAKKVSNQMVLYFPTSHNCFCTTWGIKKAESCVLLLKR